MASSIVASSLYAGMHMLTPAAYRWREIVSICSGATSIKFIAPRAVSRSLQTWRPLRPCSGHALRLCARSEFYPIQVFLAAKKEHGRSRLGRRLKENSFALLSNAFLGGRYNTNDPKTRTAVGNRSDSLLDAMNEVSKFAA